MRIHPARAVAALALFAAAGSASATNVLVIIADDLGVDKVERFSDYGSYSPTFVPATPTIDQLADAGLSFTAAWSSPVCSPTRAGMNTGLYAYHNGVGWGIPEDSGADGELDNAAYTTLAEELVAGGYDTAMFGKYHLGVTGSGGRTDWNLAATDPDPLTVSEDPHSIVGGYQVYIGDPNGAVEYYDDWDRVDAPGGGTSTIATETTHPDDVSVDEALSWIGTRSNPWFAVVSFNAPHTKHATPNNYEVSDVDPSCYVDACMADDTCGDYDGDGSSSGDLERLVYQSMVQCMDTRIDTLLSGMSVPVLRDTIIIFLGDNGTPQNVLEGPYDDTSAHAQGKNQVYESGVKVPMTITAGRHWRDLDLGRAFSLGPIRSPGREVTSPVSTIDIFDTVLSIAGVALPAGNDALSLWQCASLSTSPTCATPRGGRRLYTEGFDYNGSGTLTRGLAAIRNQQYKLVATYSRSGACLATELYDLNTDPHEATDISSSNTFSRDSLRGRLTAMAVPWMAGLPWC